MQKRIFVGFVLMAAMASFAMAAGNSSSQMVGGDRDAHGCLTSAGYSWNATEERCVREWETGETRYQTQEQAKTQARTGNYVNANGEQIRLQTQANNRIRLEAGGVGVECDCNMSQETIQNRTRLYAHLSNGANAEIKVMPDAASETALARLRLRVCTAEKNCTLQLKEVGNQDKNQTRLAYELQTERQARVFGLFKAQMRVQAQVDAENGEVIKVQKPWWAFLASEPTE